MTTHAVFLPRDPRGLLGSPIVWSATLGMVLATCAAWSVGFTRGAYGLSSLWIAGGVLCGVLLGTPKSRWPLALAVGFVAWLAVNSALRGFGPVVVAVSLANTLEVALVAGVVAALVDDPGRLSQVRRSVTVAAAATLAGCTVAALIVVAARTRWMPEAAAPGHLYLTWLASHSIGMAIFATLTIAARVEGRHLFGMPGKRVELAATLLLVAIVCLVVFSQQQLATYWIFPPLFVCIFRHRFSGFVLGIALIALIATTATAAGDGPFIPLSDDDFERTWQLQAFLASLCVVAFPVAAVLTQRRLLLHRIEAREREFRMLADNSTDLVGRIGADGQQKYISPSVVDLLGRQPEESAGTGGMDWVHPDDLEALRRGVRQVFTTGRDGMLQYRARHRDGHDVWLEAKMRRVIPEDADATPELVYVARDVTRRVEAEQALERLARSDALTGLGNRLQFMERLQLAFARARRSSRPPAVLYMDIDHFKQINDTRGHAAGDAVLRAFASRLAGCVREVDLPARLGGDEFVVLVEDADSAEVPAGIAEKLLAAVRAPVDVDGGPVQVTTSIGVAIAAPGMAPEALMQAADTALYAAKAAGRNTWRMAP